MSDVISYPVVEMTLTAPDNKEQTIITIDGRPVGLVQKVVVEMDAISHLPHVTLTILASKVVIRSHGELEVKRPVFAEPVLTNAVPKDSTTP